MTVQVTQAGMIKMYGGENMAELSKEEKKALIKKSKAAQTRKYILNKANAKKLFRYLETQLRDMPCDHTLRDTQQWLKDNLPKEKGDSIIAEMKEMGGYCDCEVLLNCYETYDIV